LELTHHHEIPFIAFPGPPPQDLDALMSYDRMIFEHHPGLSAFMRPLCAADEWPRPDGCTCNAMLVCYLAPGIRDRRSMAIAGIDLSQDGWVSL
jgi:hypothetical protein